MAYRPAEKLVVLGVDGPILPTMQRLMEQGYMPFTKKMAGRGTWAEHCMVPYPTITPPNWTTIATGASAGRTGFTDFNVHRLGEPLNVTHAAFDARWHTAEYLWEAAERAGKRSIVVNWPSSWPSRLKAGYQLAGYGLSPDGERVTLFVTPLCQMTGWSDPEELAAEIVREGNCRGLPAPYLGLRTFRMSWFDADTLVEICDMHHQWLADASAHLMKTRPWDLYFSHIHTPNYFYHLFADKVDPALNRDQDDLARWQEIEARIYQSLDAAWAGIAAQAPRRSLYVFVSDHGAKATGYRCNPGRVLIDAGLTVMTDADDPAAAGNFAGYSGRKLVDWSRTRAVVNGSCFVWVNLKGRDPDGIVEPEDYERVQNKIIRARYDYTDPATGLKPFAFAIKKQDARFLDLYGDTTGDVVFCYAGEYGAQHGPQFPSARHGMGDLRGLWLFSGPGVRSGHVLERNVNLKDVVPTMCYLMELPVPKDAEGAVVYQALEDPEAPAKERARLQRHVDVLTGVEESEAAMTHTYHRATG